MSLGLLLTSYPVVTLGTHFKGQETNVAMLACLVNSDAPHRIDVVAWSVNATATPLPNISRGHSCAQTLHELMTSGFMIAESSLENLIFVFVLTRSDPSEQKH
jgi:hypothetical protein